MALLPSGFALPPTPYLLAVIVVAGLVGVALWLSRPAINQTTVVSFAPWMVVGSALYALFQADVFPEPLAPFFGSPVVYVTTFALAGLVWAGATRYEAMAPVLVATVGSVVMAGAVGLAIAVGLDRGTLDLLWPIVSLTLAGVIAGAVWLVGRSYSLRLADTGYAGMLVVFGHALDGVSTAVGADVLGFGEQTPLSRIVLDIGAALPIADIVGTGWLFVTVKLGLAVAVTLLMADLVRDDPRQGYFVLGLIAAVGLGPGAHNLILFAIAG